MIDGKILIEKLIIYAKTFLGLDELDVIYTRNVLLHEFGFQNPTIDNLEDFDVSSFNVPDVLINEIIEFATSNNIVKSEQEGDMFACYIFGLLSPKPSDVNRTFVTIKENFGSQKACDYLYNLSVKNYYIKKSATDKNVALKADKLRNSLEIVINLGEPKNNNDINNVTTQTASQSYPLCNICKENEGYYGNQTQPSHCNLRTVSISLANEDWAMQYYPYSYFNEHCIVFNKNHVPMKVTGETVTKLFDFIETFPNYFIGCNLDLISVNESLLNHEYFQGGKYVMPLHNVKALKSYKSKVYKDVAVEILDFYNSVIRISGFNRNSVEILATEIIEKWKTYSDEAVNLIASTDGVRHNSVIPIARFLGDNRYCVELILRNNRTSEEYPNGIFNARKEHYNIVNKGVDLIECMGLFVLPERLKRQLYDIANILCKNVEYNKEEISNKKNDLYIHRKMIATLIKKYPNIKDFKKASAIINEYVNKTCADVLENTSVFKKDRAGIVAFNKFLDHCNVV